MYSFIYLTRPIAGPPVDLDLWPPMSLDPISVDYKIRIITAEKKCRRFDTVLLYDCNNV